MDKNMSTQRKNKFTWPVLVCRRKTSNYGEVEIEAGIPIPPRRYCGQGDVKYGELVSLLKDLRVGESVAIEFGWRLCKSDMSSLVSAVQYQCNRHKIGWCYRTEVDGVRFWRTRWQPRSDKDKSLGLQPELPGFDKESEVPV